MSPTTKQTIKTVARFQGVTIGQETARLGLIIDRGKLTPAQVDKNFRNARLHVVITIEDDPEQNYIDGFAPPTLESVADVTSYTASENTYTAGLRFNKGGVDCSQLAEFAGKAGTVRWERIGAVPEKERKPEDGKGNGEADG